MNNLLTVSQLNFYLRSKMEEDRLLHPLLVKGEVTAGRFAASGHFYFTMAYEGSSISCTILAKTAARLSRLPREGEACIVQADAEVSPVNSAVRLLVSDYMPQGTGKKTVDRAAYIEQLRAKGYFDPERKKNLPVLPLRIGLLTAAGSAAYADFISILEEQRVPVSVLFYPSLVQGADAPASIAMGLSALDKSGCDLLVCIRGGGSKEDLAAFDDPLVAETAALLNTPLISGVGHEIDLSVLDLIADLRVPTPTAAAKAVCGQFEGARLRLNSFEQRLQNGAARRLREKENSLLILQKILPAFSPAGRLREDERQLASCRNAMERAFFGQLQRESQRLSAGKIALNTGVKQMLLRWENQVEKTAASMFALSPVETLRRGYAIPVRKARGPLQKDEHLHLIFADAEADAILTDVQNKEEESR